MATDPSEQKDAERLVEVAGKHGRIMTQEEAPYLLGESFGIRL